MSAPRTRKEALEAIKELEEEIENSKQEILDCKAAMEEEGDKIEDNQKEIEVLQRMIERMSSEGDSQLERLNTLVQQEGTGHERAIMDTVMSGGNVAKDEIERVKILGIQLLHEAISI